MNINIEQVANGFVVVSLGGAHREKDCHVFQTLASLFEHIRSVQTLEVVPVNPYETKEVRDAVQRLVGTPVESPITYGHPEN